MTKPDISVFVWQKRIKQGICVKCYMTKPDISIFPSKMIRSCLITGMTRFVTASRFQWCKLFNMPLKSRRIIAFVVSKSFLLFSLLLNLTSYLLLSFNGSKHIVSRKLYKIDLYLGLNKACYSRLILDCEISPKWPQNVYSEKHIKPMKPDRYPVLSYNLRDIRFCHS